ncbi:MAG: threonine--tRNA ligase [Pseudomonadota bacterium]|nr:threonine--tRNA ligase [Pseudomonadota bacterium]
MQNQADTSSDNKLHAMRHSCAHILATAIQKIWPDAQFGVGPVIEGGFYYDIKTPEAITEQDLARIETTMRKIKKKKHPFVCEEREMDDAIRFMRSTNQPFKVELLELLRDKGSTAISKAVDGDDLVSTSSDNQDVRITFYKTDTFVDLCRGPHVAHSGEIGHFKLHKIAGAYWRGDEKNMQLQRIYGLCFPTKELLEAEIDRLEKLKECDHRRLNKDLEIYHMEDDIGRGLPLWLPNGTVIKKELEHLAMQYERMDAYKMVSTPHLAKEKLYYQSGHLPYYEEDMYNPIELDNENYYLRPMNCPHHHMIYKSSMRSYRDLPLRYTEWGQVYRYEKSGALNGLMRVRGLCINDAHIYCRYDQVKEEFKKVMQMHATFYQIFDIHDFSMVLALPDYDKKDKYSDDKENWEMTATKIREAMDELGFPYHEEEGEAAFYGPKIDFTIKSALGTTYTISTCQLDFMAPKRFDLHYRGESGENEPCLVIHRAPLGTHERFIAFLLEHYGGALPTWIAPVQAMLIPIADRHLAYTQSIYQRLFSAPIATATGGLRVEIDASHERMQKKIRSAQVKKIPYMLVIGDKEVEQETISVRHRSGENLGTMHIDELIERIKQEVTSRADQPKETS